MATVSSNTKSSTSLGDLSVDLQPVSVPMQEYGDAFWGDQPSILFRQDRLSEFFPVSEQTLPERMNAISRLIIYTAIAMSVYQSKPNAAHFGVLLLGLLYLMWKNSNYGKSNGLVEHQTTEHFRAAVGPKEKCVMPTAQNPFMNFLPGDMPGRDPACTGPGVQETSVNLLDSQLFNDVDDLYSKNANQRLFRTMPNTTGMPDRERYASWLIKGETGCKTTGDCPPYEDLKMQRHLIPEDLEEDFNVEGYTTF